MESSQKSFFNGEWHCTEGSPFRNHNPITNTPLDTYQSAQEQDVDAALDGAQQGYASYRQLSGQERAHFLNQLAIEIETLGDDLLETAHRETGLGLPRLTGERARTCNQLRAFADLLKEGSWVRASIDTADAERTPPKPDLRRMMRPIGPVLVFPASNFPLAFGVLGGDTASALAAGNPVVIKGHPAHPATAELCMVAAERALKTCNLPLTLISLLQGNALSLAQYLVAHPTVQAVGFTGSLKAGRAIMDQAAQREIPIPVYAEMGSTNPVFISPEAMANRGKEIASGLAASISLGTGQFCTSPGVIVGLDNNEFIDQLAEALNQAPLGNLLHPSLAEGLVASIKQLQDNPNTVLVTGCEAMDAAGLRPQNSLLKTSAQAFLKDPTLHEEAFGPVSLYVSCQSEKEMAQVAQAVHGNLTATLHAETDEALTATLAQCLEGKVGRLIYNGYPTGVEVCASQQHGGSYPACSVASSTSVGTDAISRFARFVAYQDMPQDLLPVELQDSNEPSVLRLVDGKESRTAL